LKPENFDKLFDFNYIIKQIDPSRLKFADEKHLKGSELYSKYVRRFVSAHWKSRERHIDSEFRNTYNIVGICGINKMTRPFFFRLSDDTNDSFHSLSPSKTHSGGRYINRGEVLVLENAPIHCSAEIQEFDDWLYQDTESSSFTYQHVIRSPTLLSACGTSWCSASSVSRAKKWSFMVIESPTRRRV
jgi:hypothetical protein